MRQTTFALCSCLALLALSACDRAADNAPVDAAPSAADQPAAASDDASMRYSCEGSYRVSIIGDTARVTTADGHEINLSRVADRSPPLFAGEALEFSVEGDGAVLSQDEGGPFPCVEAE